MNELASILPEAGLARFLWDVAWQSTLVGFVTLVVLRWRSAKPAVQAGIALLGIVLSIVSPACTGMVRAGGYGWLSSGSERSRGAAIQSEIAATSAPPSKTDPALMDEQKGGGFPNSELPHSAAARLAPGAGGPLPFARPSLLSLFVSHFWTLCAALWVAASLALAVRMLNDLRCVARIRREATLCCDSAILGACRAAAVRLGLPTAPAIAHSSAVNCPTILAWGKPLVFLPPRGSSCFENSGRDHDSRWFAIFCHELGHVLRRDGWCALAVAASVIFLPWQPLVWLLRREFQRACEEACDDWALFAGVDPADYAAALVAWVPRLASPLSLGIRSNCLPIRQRIERVLKMQDVPSPGLGRAWTVAAGSAAATMAAAMAFFQSGPSAAFSEDPTLASRRFATPAVVDSRATRTDDGLSSVDIPLAVIGHGRLRHWHDAHVLGFGPDGDSILSAGRDGLLQIWDASSGLPRRTLYLPHAVAAASGDGRWLFLGQEDGKIEVHDAATGNVKDVLLAGPVGNEARLLFRLIANHDGTILACAGRCGGTSGKDRSWIAVWDVPSKRPRWLLQGEAELLAGYATGWECLALSRDGQFLAAASLHTISCWSLANGERAQTIKADHRVYALDFHPHGHSLASGDAGGIAKVWDLASGQERLRFERPMNTIRSLAYSPSGEHLAIADGEQIRLWDANTGSNVWSHPLSAVHPFSVEFDPEDRWIAVAAGNGLALLDARTGLPPFGGSPEAEATALATGSDMLFTGNADGAIAVWSFAEKRQLRTWRAHGAAIDALAVSPNGNTLASAARDGTLMVWDAGTGEPLRKLDGSLTNHLAFSPDGRVLAAMGPAQTIGFWDLERGENDEQVLWREAGIWRPFAFGSEGRSLFAADASRRDALVLWDLDSRQIAQRWDEDSRNYSGLQLAVSIDFRFAAAGVYGQRFAVWDLHAGRKIQLAGEHRGRLQSLAFSPGGYLASTAEDGRICLWSPSTGELAGALTVGPAGGRVRQVVFSGDGRSLATLNGNGTVSIFQSPVP
jgi:WD40 repeat protein/beta-lactamase regulating signal transducer with metallopeptidase domain